MSNWWKRENSEIDWNNENFRKIVEFYLLNCPCEFRKGKGAKGTLKRVPVSQRGTTFSQQGWQNANFKTLTSHMKKGLFFKSCNANESVSAVVKTNEQGTGFSDPNFEIVVFSKRDDMSEPSAVFYTIRNALAHGSFSVVKGVYIFESKKNEVKAQIRLREETLLYWIDLFNASPAELRKTKKRKKIACQKAA